MEADELRRCKNALETENTCSKTVCCVYKNKINLPDNTLMIELDWKQKVLVGMDNYTIFLKQFSIIFSSLKQDLALGKLVESSDYKNNVRL